MSFPAINPTSTQAWKKLQAHAEKMKQVHMRDLFSSDADRFSSYSIKEQNILFDYSKNLVVKETLDLLFELANECKLKDAIASMFAGEKINQTEGRAVLHTALRNFSDKTVLADGVNVMPKV